MHHDLRVDWLNYKKEMEAESVGVLLGPHVPSLGEP